jgi:hypothetical protein
MTPGSSNNNEVSFELISFWSILCIKKCSFKKFFGRNRRIYPLADYKGLNSS